MNLPKKIATRRRTYLIRTSCGRSVERVIETRQLTPGNLPFIASSMVPRRRRAAHLAAVQSFRQIANSEHIVIACDPAIGSPEGALINACTPQAEFRCAEWFGDFHLPQVRIWRRLTAIMTSTPNSDVEQFGSNLITAAPMQEVVSVLGSNCDFVLAEPPEHGIVTRDETDTYSNGCSHHRSQAPLKRALACSGSNPTRHSWEAVNPSFFRRTQKPLLSGASNRCLPTITLELRDCGIDALAFSKPPTPLETMIDTAFLHIIGSVHSVKLKYKQADLFRDTMLSSTEASKRV